MWLRAVITILSASFLCLVDGKPQYSWNFRGELCVANGNECPPYPRRCCSGCYDGYCDCKGHYAVCTRGIDCCSKKCLKQRCTPPLKSWEQVVERYKMQLHLQKLYSTIH